MPKIRRIPVRCIICPANLASHTNMFKHLDKHGARCISGTLFACPVSGCAYTTLLGIDHWKSHIYDDHERLYVRKPAVHKLPFRYCGRLSARAPPNADIGRFNEHEADYDMRYDDTTADHIQMYDAVNQVEQRLDQVQFMDENSDNGSDAVMAGADSEDAENDVNHGGSNDASTSFAEFFGNVNTAAIVRQIADSFGVDEADAFARVMSNIASGFDADEETDSEQEVNNNHLEAAAVDHKSYESPRVAGAEGTRQSSQPIQNLPQHSSPPQPAQRTWTFESKFADCIDRAHMDEYWASDLCEDNDRRKSDIIQFLQDAEQYRLSADVLDTFRMFLDCQRGYVPERCIDRILNNNNWKQPTGLGRSAKTLGRHSRRLSDKLFRPLMLDKKAKSVMFIPTSRIIQYWALATKGSKSLLEKYCKFKSLSDYVDAEKKGFEALGDRYRFKNAMCGSVYQRLFEVIREQANKYHPNEKDLEDVYVVSLQDWIDGASMYKAEAQNPQALVTTAAEFPLHERHNEADPSIVLQSLMAKAEANSHGYEIWWKALRSDFINGLKGVDIFMPEKKKFVKVYYVLHSVLGDIQARREAAGFGTGTARNGCMYCEVPTRKFAEEVHELAGKEEAIDPPTYSHESFMCEVHKLTSRGPDSVSAKTVEQRTGLKYASGLLTIPLFRAPEQLPLDLLHMEPAGRIYYLLESLRRAVSGHPHFWVLFGKKLAEYTFAEPNVHFKSLRVLSAGAELPFRSSHDKMMALLAMPGFLEDLFEEAFPGNLDEFMEAADTIAFHARFVELARRKSITVGELDELQKLAPQSSSRCYKLRKVETCPPKYHEVLHVRRCILQTGPLPYTSCFVFETVFQRLKNFGQRCSNHQNACKGVFQKLTNIRALETLCETVPLNRESAIDSVAMPIDGVSEAIRSAAPASLQWTARSRFFGYKKIIVNCCPVEHGKYYRGADAHGEFIVKADRIVGTSGAGISDFGIVGPLFRVRDGQWRFAGGRTLQCKPPPELQVRRRIAVVRSGTIQHAVDVQVVKRNFRLVASFA